jgi:protein ImuB
LVRALCSFLHLRGLGTTRIAIEFRHEYLPATRVVLGVALTRSEVHLSRVLRERMQRITLVAPAEAIALSGEECAPLASQQATLLPGNESATVVDDVMDRVRARLDADQVFGLVLHGDHRPEHAFRQRPPGYVSSVDCVGAPRPLWLLREPTALYGTPQQAGYALINGPERIESGWWDGKPMRRDYFIAHDHSGCRCWLYRTDQGLWFMHGRFG